MWDLEQWQPTSLKMESQVSRQYWLQEQSRLSQEKDCLQSSGGMLGLTGRKQSKLCLCKWIQEKHYPFHHQPQGGPKRQGSERSSEHLWSHCKWDAFAPGVLPWSQTILTGSSPNSSWILPARDPEMEHRWAHTIPNGVLVWVPLCHPSGQGWREI